MTLILMRDISVKTAFMKFLYGYAWVGFLIFGAIVIWIIALLLYNYRDYDKEKVKGLLNKSSQKLIFWYGVIVNTGMIVLIILFQLIKLIW